MPPMQLLSSGFFVGFVRVRGAVASWLVSFCLWIEKSGFEPWPLGHCVVFLGMTLYSHSASLHPGVQMGTSECNAGGNAEME